jgi:hypothetical protein
VQNFIRLFVRIGPGMWTCVRNGELEGPNGRIQVTLGSTFTKGTSFMGIDLAALLEEEHEKKNGNAHPQASQSPLSSTHDPIRPLPSRE